MACEDVAADDAVYHGQLDFRVGLVDGFEVEGDALVVADFEFAETKRGDAEGGAFQLAAADAGGDAFFLHKLRVFDESRDGVRVEDRTRRSRVDEEMGIFPVDFPFYHQVKAVALDVEDAHGDFYEMVHQKLGLTAKRL